MREIGTSSHHHYFVVRENGGAISVLALGNPNDGLSYHERWCDIDGRMVKCDTRAEAEAHRRLFIDQLRSEGYAKSFWSGWKIVRGDLILRLNLPAES